MNVKVIKAEGIKAQAEKKANKQASEILAEAKAYAQSKMTEGENKANILTLLA